MRTPIEHYDAVLLRATEQLVARTLGDSFHKHFVSFPMQRWLDSADRRFCKAIISFRRRTFTSSGTLSSRCLEAYVPGRSEYLNMKAASYPHSSIRESERGRGLPPFRSGNREYIRCQSAIGNDTFDSGHTVQIPFSGIFAVHQFQDTGLPLCTGRWICLHTLGTCAITSSVSSLISFG